MTKNEEPHNIHRLRIDDRIKELEIRLHNLQACRPQTCIVCQLLKKREEANRIQGLKGGRVIIDDPLNKTSD